MNDFWIGKSDQTRFEFEIKIQTKIKFDKKMFVMI